MLRTKAFNDGFRAYHNGAPSPASNDRSDYARGYWYADETFLDPNGGIESGDCQED